MRQKPTADEPAAFAVEFSRSLFVEPATDTVGGDALEELLTILAEEGVRRQAERDRRREKLHVVAS